VGDVMPEFAGLGRSPSPDDNLASRKTRTQAGLRVHRIVTPRLLLWARVHQIGKCCLDEFVNDFPWYVFIVHHKTTN